MSIVQRNYKCGHCQNEFWVFQPVDDEKIAHCPSCEKTDMQCTERVMQQ